MDECGRRYGITSLYGFGCTGRTNFYFDVGALTECKRIGPVSCYIPYSTVERSIIIVTCAMSQRTLRKYGLKLGNQIAINGVGVRRIDDIAGVDNIIDIYVPATGSVRHCKCAQNPLSGKRTTFTKIS